mmetsp:Transcript_45455/g.74228  ORF Transcript_45455/g.74228 Transcript_45455/m.74228 type:complete len:123 (+) Transcript_45455:2147-2515(+)
MIQELQGVGVNCVVFTRNLKTELWQAPPSNGGYVTSSLDNQFTDAKKYEDCSGHNLGSRPYLIFSRKRHRCLVGRWYNLINRYLGTEASLAHWQEGEGYILSSYSMHALRFTNCPPPPKKNK